MSTLALPMPSKDKQPVLHAANLNVELTNTLREINLHVEALPTFDNSGKSSVLLGFGGLSEGQIKVTGSFKSRLYAQEAYLNAMAFSVVNQSTGVGVNVARMEQPKLSFRQKVDLLLDGASSVFALGSEKPKKLSDAEIQHRIHGRRDSYRRYIGGRKE